MRRLRVHERQSALMIDPVPAGMSIPALGLIRENHRFFSTPRDCLTRAMNSSLVSPGSGLTRIGFLLSVIVSVSFALA